MCVIANGQSIVGIILEMGNTVTVGQVHEVNDTEGDDMK